MVSYSRTVTVSASGAVNGTFSFDTFDADPGEPCPAASHTITMQGNFVSNNRIEGNFIWDSTNTSCGGSTTVRGAFTYTR
jgi:hypothetical protein